MRFAWTELRTGSGRNITGGAFDDATPNALAASQAFLTNALDSANLTLVDNYIASNNATRREFIAWKQLDKFSCSVLSGLPTYFNRIASDYFSEIVANIMLLPSPALADAVGRTIYPSYGSPQPCDEFGDVLMGKRMCGGAWQAAHNGIRDILIAICEDAGLPGGAKEPEHIFLGAIDNSRWEAFRKSRHNIRPDFLFNILRRHDDALTTPTIFDVKNIFSFDVHYTQPDRHFAVKNTETEWKNNYVAKARKLDAEFHGTAANARGPIQQRLDALGGIYILAFGRFGETNQTVQDLLGACALAKARRVASTRQVTGQSFLRNNDVDVNYWKAHFLGIYTRVLSSSVGYFKAGVIISRKGLIGLQKAEQAKAAETTGSHPSLTKLVSGFGRDHFGANTGTHYYDTNSNPSSRSTPSGSDD
jgi:hypothetical protein